MVAAVVAMKRTGIEPVTFGLQTRESEGVADDDPRRETSDAGRIR
jgi:hypothetical protein